MKTIQKIFFFFPAITHINIDDIINLPWEAVEIF